jgi:hypothetical protein
MDLYRAVCIGRVINSIGSPAENPNLQLRDRCCIRDACCRIKLYFTLPTLTFSNSLRYLEESFDCSQALVRFVVDTSPQCAFQNQARCKCGPTIRLCFTSELSQEDTSNTFNETRMHFPDGCRYVAQEARRFRGRDEDAGPP